MNDAEKCLLSCKRVRDCDSKVLVRLVLSFVFLRVEWSVVEGRPEGFSRVGTSATGVTRCDGDYNSDFFGVGEGVLGESGKDWSANACGSEKYTDRPPDFNSLISCLNGAPGLREANVDTLRIGTDEEGGEKGEKLHVGRNEEWTRAWRVNVICVRRLDLGVVGSREGYHT